MANKNFKIDDDLTVTVYKRRSNRNLRLSVASSGQVRVSIPAWAPYKAGVDFARSREAWIRSQQLMPSLLVEGQLIGKAHHLVFSTKAGLVKPTSRLSGSKVNVFYPLELSPSDSVVQKTATEAAVKALRAQAEQLLPQRLHALANRHGFTYMSVSIKRLKGRWGSCDQQRNIVLNLFLMQLSWDLIDYVLLHELTHTEVLRHGPDFWRAMQNVLPDVTERRKTIRQFHPVLLGEQ